SRNMSTIAPDSSLPATLSSQLSDEQRQQVFESSRGQRLKMLATVLKVSEPEALTALAVSSGFDVATNLEADPEALNVFPARLVHDYQIVPILFRGGSRAPAPETAAPADDQRTPVHLATAWLPDSVMVDWIRTFTHRPFIWHLGVPEKIHQLILQHFG